MMVQEKAKIKGGKDKDAEKFQYFYHPDHLGSTSYITDALGEVYQHLEYFAFGETFVEEHSNTKHTPYKFNGKELDEETGLYYYGARYYDARTSVWLSVDPMAERRSWVTPYNFVQNNPLTRIDPDGLTDFELNTETGQINQVGDATDTPDRLLDSKNNNIIVGDVDKGLLKDGMNIQKNGMQTTNVKGGTKLAVGISMYTSEEIGGVIYEDSDGGRMLNVLPYEGQTLVTNNSGEVTQMNAGFSLKLKQSLTSIDGSFKGKPIAAFHTHPGHPNAASSATYLGTPRPSGADLNIGLANKKYNNVSVPYFIYGKKQMNYKGVTSNTSYYQPQSDGGIPWKLRPRSWKK